VDYIPGVPGRTSEPWFALVDERPDRWACERIVVLSQEAEKNTMRLNIRVVRRGIHQEDAPPIGQDWVVVAREPEAEVDCVVADGGRVI
jgi:hypothetical protein